jgi:hypothetical protein
LWRLTKRRERMTKTDRERRNTRIACMPLPILSALVQSARRHLAGWLRFHLTKGPRAFTMTLDLVR